MEPAIPEHQNSDIEMIRKMEDEHLRLQRQIRMVQTDRLHRALGVHPLFRRQDHLLRTLKKESLNLYKDLKVEENTVHNPKRKIVDEVIARSGAHKKIDKKMEEDLTLALLYRTQNEEEYKERQSLMEQLDELLHRKSKEMLHLKNIVNANKGQLEVRRSLSENRLTWADNKLEVAMWRFNEVQCENKKIREKIEHVLNDRALFNQAWRKMLTALNKGKKFLTDLFESSTLAYDQRDEWCAKLKSAHEKGKMDQMVQVQEMRDLQKSFDHEMNQYKFLEKKGLIRINKKREDREEAQKIKQEKDIQQKIETHAKILSDINEYTKEFDINKIIDQFERAEHDNFSMYKLLNEYCAENEVLKRSLEQIKQDIANRKDWNDMIEDQRQKKLEELEDKLEKQKAVTKNKRDQLSEMLQLLENTTGSVKEIFKMLDCSLEPYQNLLGDKQPTLNHLSLSFRIISDKIMEMVQIAYYYERHLQKKGHKSSSRLKKYTVRPQPVEYWTAAPIQALVPADPCPSCVEARWLSRVSDTLEVPFNKAMALSALKELAEEPAFERSDRIHPLVDCRVPRSRIILARRYMNY